MVHRGQDIPRDEWDPVTPRQCVDCTGLRAFDKMIMLVRSKNKTVVTKLATYGGEDSQTMLNCGPWHLLATLAS